MNSFDAGMTSAMDHNHISFFPDGVALITVEESSSPTLGGIKNVADDGRKFWLSTDKVKTKVAYFTLETTVKLRATITIF